MAAGAAGGRPLLRAVVAPLALSYAAALGISAFSFAHVFRVEGQDRAFPILAATFAVLGTLPVVGFAEIGFAVALGALLDTLVVRSVLVTALTADLDHRTWWPGRLARAGPGSPPPTGAGRPTGAEGRPAGWPASGIGNGKPFRNAPEAISRMPRFPRSAGERSRTAHPAHPSVPGTYPGGDLACSRLVASGPNCAGCARRTASRSKGSPDNSATARAT
ncbi:hypothetical protein GCM10009759_22690 [Kitasatospora saccharophila]|uniref:Membrane transport protein MMPL domain-containing protein n=1 Tax=Kitasatospora saccharophila TaxID=407973 RepID=A0ABN2WLE4_9ACTN